MAEVPLVSVVMPVRDAHPFLDESIGSLMVQTFDDFELVIVDNGSTDGSTPLLEAWAGREPRIRLFHTPEGLGRVGSSNRVVAHARGRYVARMDGDDISHPSRIERQVAVLERRPDAAVVGTLCVGIDEDGRRLRPRDRSRLTRPGTESPFPHGSMMFRRSAFDQVGGYREDCEGWEDLDLIHRLAEAGSVYVIASALYSVRFRAASTHRSMSAKQFLEVSEQKGRVVAGRFPEWHAAMPDDLDALYEREAEKLWTGGRPDLLAELDAHGLAHTMAGRRALRLWARWGRIHPASLRAALRLAIWARDRMAARHVAEGEEVEWHFG
jgi:glycosyltransferase involved in cell wall biosynthesis